MHPRDEGHSSRSYPLGVAERRRHVRFLEEVRVRFRDLEGADPSGWGRTRDLSLGGLCLLTNEPVEVGSHLALELHIEQETAPLLVLARVLRCFEESEAVYASGLEFLWVGHEDRSSLRRLADHFKRNYGTTGDLRRDEAPSE